MTIQLEVYFLCLLLLDILFHLLKMLHIHYNILVFLYFVKHLYYQYFLFLLIYFLFRFQHFYIFTKHRYHHGAHELGHLEMIAAIVHQLTRNLTDQQLQDNPGFAAYFVDHTAGIYPTAASGFPWSAASMAVKGDPICDLTEDMAAEQKARVTYDNILRLAVDDPDVTDVIRFLREREIVHFQRFGSALQMVRDQLDQRNVYYTNPAFDK